MCVLAFFDAGGVSPDSSLTIRLTKRRYPFSESHRWATYYAKENLQIPKVVTPLTPGT